MKSSQPSAVFQVIRESWYEGYYGEKGADRNSLLRNPEVLYQSLAQEASIIRALQMIRPDPQAARVLDVGCGAGASLGCFLRLGFDPQNLYGVDFQEARVQEARARFGGIHFQNGDATQMEFASESFDLVLESTMFVHSVDEEMSRRIAGEMLRATKSGGYLLLCDWRYGKPGSRAHKALSQKRIWELFGVGRETVRCGVFRGQLVPPVGRFLSRRLPSIYFLVRGLLPVLVGQMTTVLRKA
ncbi:MAG TPA: class I SAM-dependent methyltransferase [Candidatus Acidoferrum sp.]|nr:class I SAM-dependent methyltransferase [Candidatus Acidoferrum sp.]